jgi:hypothetical protein
MDFCVSIHRPMVNSASTAHSCPSQTAIPCTRVEQLQTENEKPVQRIGPTARSGYTCGRREKPKEIGKHSNYETKCKGGHQRRASAAEYFQSLSVKFLLRVEEAASSVEAIKHELKAPDMQGPMLESAITCQSVNRASS